MNTITFNIDGEEYVFENVTIEDLHEFMGKYDLADESDLDEDFGDMCRSLGINPIAAENALEASFKKGKKDVNYCMGNIL